MIVMLIKFLYIIIFFSSSLKHLTSAQESNQFIYNGFTGSNLNLCGSTTLHSNGLLELTNISDHQIGRVFFPTPLNFNKSMSFSTNFIFAIDPENPDLGGHGFVFTLSPKIEFTGAMPTEYFGIFNSSTNGQSSNHIFAVEFDTIQTVDLGDIDDNHVGIDLNSLISNVSAPASYFSDKEQVNKTLKLISRNRIQVWIDYDQQQNLLNVTLAPITSSKPEKPLLSKKIDLSLVLLDSMYVGFSSSTGSMASHHYILGWSFNRTGPAQNLDLSKLPPLPSRPKSGKSFNPKVIMGSTMGIVILIIIIYGLVYIIRRNKFEEFREDWEKEYGPQRFSYKNLYKACKGFKEKELLGFGGFGKVYRGLLPSSNVQVAVKKVSHDSQQGMKEFVAEIVSMGQLRHRNLVQLLGYCRRKGELLLVYDYMPNGSLDKYLFRNDTPNLNWDQRYQILKGVASALLYLHEEWEQVVLHRDVKASNVMLDSDFIGRLGDFGLAKFYDHGSDPQTTIMVGTIGYLAPEVSRTGRATTCSDIFSFGILMLEVACGRKPVDWEMPTEEVILADWVLDRWKNGLILETCDSKLEGKFMVEEMELVLKLGLFCAHSTPASRPTMRQVVQYLDRNANLPEILMDSSGLGFITVGHDSGEDWSLCFPTSNDFSGLSSSSPILSSVESEKLCGRSKITVSSYD
ncbi:L-type lectin-domain containing receptor kinase IV.2-like [Mercurialis annua]|uniref:L-type lectin-domain containing receptor kinase IV.2-like n=1 Tax=Mercurialis annua TaxID=3986 RepID=UPI00215FA8AC|nr:L-type lectin-domain containing receptor kinase IV.2-like [Mercurialis annua]